MSFENVLKFKGKWRSYQARILDSADKYLGDNKIHIVAAPGSGKTTLGIELIGRLNEPTLVLVPSITIREQWISRIEEAFLCDDCRTDEYLSQNLKNPKAITVVTYQALYSAMIRYKGKVTGKIDEIQEEATEITQNGNMDSEEVDYTDFDLITKIKESGIRVLCLDECHHLRNEWWKALEDFKSQMPEFKTIALTATPPYDSTPDAWKRYINMCGEIDEEITTPELVKDGSLCPHQDYIFFNYPTSVEKETLQDYEDKAIDVQDALMQDETFASYISTHRFLNEEVDNDILLDHPIYLASIIIFAHQVKIPFPTKLKKLLGAKDLPEMDLKWMEALLQGFLYDDVDSFRCDKDYRKQIIAMLKENGLIEKKKVMLSSSVALDKMLINSIGKCISIKRIVFHEYRTLGKSIRLLILTDYIRKEYENAVGEPRSDVDALGVIPFFEMIRRGDQNDEIRLGILCGSVVVIPAEAKQELDILIEGIGAVTYSNFGNLPMSDYLKVTEIGNKHFLTAAVTNLFQRGYFQVLIGTKSLLGEGWDSPCINSLILASFVGSFMLSNQMRGRAIRIMKGNPDKTSNIWHLVCIRPRSEMLKDEYGNISQDFSTMTRRMQNFLGLHYEENTIESGIDRFSIINKLPLSKYSAEDINKQMLTLSSARDTLRDRWNSALTVYNKMEVVDEVQVADDRLKCVLFEDSLLKLVLSFFMQLPVFIALGIRNVSGDAMMICILWMIMTALTGLIQVPKIFTLFSPFRRLKAFGNGIRTALEKRKLFEDTKSKVVVESLLTIYQVVYLNGGTGRDKELFKKCLNEFFGEIDNQRYILVKDRFFKGSTGYFPVPDCFAKKKEDAELFADCMKKYIGKYKLVYTRNEEGRRILLEGRVKGLMNRKARVKNRKKVKGALE